MFNVPDARPTRATKSETSCMTQHLFDLTGRVAIVTGGNGGIGLGMAQALARAGCNVSIWGRNEAKNEAAVASLKDARARSRRGCATSPARSP